MKKILIATNILLLGIIAFLLSNERNAIAQISPPQLQPPEKVVEMGVEDDHREGLIDYNVAMKMSRDFKNDLGKGRITGTLQRDATSIWFSLETLKGFIDKIEHSLIVSRCNPKLGVRIYYAKYPVQLSTYPCLNGLSGMVANRHTVFMVPTYRDLSRRMEVDFNIDHPGANPCQPIPYCNLPEDQKKTVSILASNKKKYYIYPNQDGSIPYIVNHGGLSPPPDGGGTFPTPDH